MPKPRTGSVYYRAPYWRGVITTDEGQRYFYGKTEDEVRAKIVTLGAKPRAHRRQADSLARKAELITRILDRANDLGWAREYTGRVLASGLTSTRLAAGVTGPCVYCGSEFADTIDHVVPLSRGGTHSADNVVSACKRCNGQKGSRTP